MLQYPVLLFPPPLYHTVVLYVVYCTFLPLLTVGRELWGGAVLLKSYTCLYDVYRFGTAIIFSLKYYSATVTIIGTNTRVTTYISELFGHAPSWQTVCLCHKISCTPLLWCCTVFVQSTKQFSYWGQRISKFMVKYVYNVFTLINMFLMYSLIKFFCCGTFVAISNIFQ